MKLHKKTIPIKAHPMGNAVRRKNLFHRNNLVVPGDLRISETLCVGGNLTVMGDLNAGSVYCLGRLIVSGEIHAGTVYTGLGVETKGDLHAISLTAKAGSGFAPNFEEVAAYIVGWAVKNGEEIDEVTAHLADESVLQELGYDIDPDTIVVAGDCIVSGPVDVVGNIVVSGLFNPDDADIWSGNLEADRIFVEGDLRVDNVSCLNQCEVQGDIHVPGFIDCARLSACAIGAGDVTTRHLEEGHSIECLSLNAENVAAGGSIMCSGSITCTGYLRSDGSITARGGIKAGKDHGILAGLGFARSEWLREGYVCCVVRPRNILTGLYRPLASRLKALEDPRPARIRTHKVVAAKKAL
jgi:cytoskeletal protein CcmA (bactofilin family)